MTNLVGKFKVGEEVFPFDLVYTNGVVQGRLGGLFDGRPFKLKCLEGRAEGVIGDLADGVVIVGRCQTEEIELRFGDALRGVDVLAALRPGEVQGVIKGNTQSLDFEMFRQGEKNTARFLYPETEHVSAVELVCDEDVSLSVLSVIAVAGWLVFDARSELLRD